MSRKEIISLIAVAQVIFVYFFGFFGWENIGNGNIYFICMANVMYSLSFVCFLFVQHPVTKVLTAILAAYFAVNLYVEIIRDGSDWEAQDFLMAIIVIFNTLLSLFAIQKNKKDE